MNTEITLPIYVKNALKRLEQSGFEAYAVGGCVRDFLLGREVFDYDITTSALPCETKAVFDDCVCLDTGIEHGTVTVIFGGVHLEITTFRADGNYSDCRHPDSVRFGVDIHDDLARRDFCINAMAYNHEVGLIDDWGGFDDLKERIIRCVGEADRRFKEDSLRILRAIRFASILDFEIETDTKKSIHKNINLTANVSAERIFAELKKLLLGQSANEVLHEFRDVINAVVPSVARYSALEYDEVCRMISFAPADLATRLEVLLCFAGEEGAKEALLRLKCDNKTKKRVTSCVTALDKVKSEDLRSACLEAYELGFCVAKDASNIKLYRAKARGNDKETALWQRKSLLIEEIKSMHLCTGVSDLMLNGSDIVKEGIAQGREVGEVLNALVYAVIDGRVQNTRCELLDYARKIAGGNAK